MRKQKNQANQENQANHGPDRGRGEEGMRGWREFYLETVTEPVKDTYLPLKSDNLNYIGLEHIEQETLRLNSIGSSRDVTSNKFVFQKNDVLFGKLRPYFRKVVKPAFSGICSTDIWVFRAKEGFSQDFLFYFLASWDFVNTASGGEGGTRMPRADWKFLCKTKWLLPPLPEQHAIASVLSSLDDKIDLLHRQNKTLEAMAEALFRQWFVEPCKNGLPEGWSEGKMPDEFDYVMGSSPPGESYNEDGLGIPMFQGNADFGFRFPTPRVYTTKPIRFAKKYDTLISVRAPVGEQNMAQEECCIGRGVAAFRCKYNGKTYTYYKLKSLMSEIRNFNDTGTVFGSISKTDFGSIEVAIPPHSLISQFELIVSPIDNKIIQNCNQIRTLEKLRDALLPKLIRGEVRVKI